MRVLILGGDGMLGHQLFKYLSGEYIVKVTLHQSLSFYDKFGLFNEKNSFEKLDIRDLDKLNGILNYFQPHAVVNCIGIVKQRPESKESIASLEVNALFPHYLAGLSKKINAYLLHLSTDCVFSGKKGSYKESDPSDAEDLYGRTKYLGELSEPHCMTLRTSMIGPEILQKKGLLEWFLGQKGTVKGFNNAIFSGLTTLELSRVIAKILVEKPQPNGIYHVSSDPISKFDLLVLIKKKFGLEIDIMPDGSYRCDRSLDSTHFRKKFNYKPPSWDEMIDDLETQQSP
jgi:dTDP-4-dehydrorhamnose reductase